MTPEAQRIAIAEACGWKIKTRPCPHSGSVTEWHWYKPGSDLFESDFRTTTQTMYPSGTVVGNPIPKELPDYLNDLNAMHEAEKVLNVEQIGDYENKLFGITDYRDTVRGEAAIFWSQHSLYRNIHATAAQRAEAFLRTIGKWIE